MSSIFLAIDGVAPRAKMNNQRDRRFRSSYESQHVDSYMHEKLQMTFEQVDFKSNSISPGTEFMLDLTQHIEFFIKRKFYEDSNWSKLKVFFSPGNVPGEGEHKIMDYVRSWSQGPDANPRDVHCVYGNDSDLVLLSLKLHLPNVFILREPNVFSDADKRVNYAAKRFTEKEDFEILYVNILREYLYLEFLDEEMMAKFDEKNESFKANCPKNRQRINAERFIDDFVLLTCLVGNDFLPAVYGLSTKNGHLDLFIRELKKFYKREGLFLVYREEILWANVALLIEQLSCHQESFLNQCLKNFRREISSYDKRKKMLTKKNRRKNSQIDGNFDQEEDTDLFLLRYKSEYDQLKSASRRMQEMVNLRSDNFARKKFYYANYFKKSGQRKSVSEKELKICINDICQNYFEGMEFKHKYYSIGCSSWVWFYRFTLCPLMEDMIPFLKEATKDPSQKLFQLELGQPFRPYIQLLHILPKRSLGLLPAIFKNTIFQDTSQKTIKKCEEGSHSPQLKNSDSETSFKETESTNKNETIEISPEKNLPCDEKFNYSSFWFGGNRPKLPEDFNHSAERSLLNLLELSFPEKFEVAAVDNTRSYTWHPQVSHIDRASMRALIYLAPWEKLSKIEQKRNDFAMDKVYYLSKEHEQRVQPSLPGFKEFEVNLFEREIDVVKEQGKDPRGMDQYYFTSQEMLEYSRFKMPSFLLKFGGLSKVALKPKVKRRREVFYLKLDGQVMTDLLLNKQIEQNLDQHFSVINNHSSQAKGTKKANRFKKLIDEPKDFLEMGVTAQNNIVESNLKKTSLQQEEKKQEAFLKNQIAMQKVVSHGWQTPTSNLLVNREFLTGKNKNNALEDILDNLRRDEFTEVENENTLFKTIEELPLVYLAQPQFASMSIYPQGKQHFCYQLKWKAGSVLKSDYSKLGLYSPFATQFRSLKGLGLENLKVDFKTGGFQEETIMDQQMSMDLQTGNLISLSKSAIKLFGYMDRGESFKDIPRVKDFKVVKTNHRIKNLKMSNTEHKIFPLGIGLLSELSLNADEAWVVWMLSDSLLVFCDRQQPSSLVLGTKYDIGLNFFNILNKKVNDYRIVNDMVNLYLEKMFDLKRVADVEQCINKYVKPRYMDLVILFETEGRAFFESKARAQRSGRKRSLDPNLDEFLEKLYQEMMQIEYALDSLISKKTLRWWRKDLTNKLFKKIDKQTKNKSEKRKRKSSIEFDGERYKLNERYRTYLKLDHWSMEDFYVDQEGFDYWEKDIQRKNYEMLESVLNCIPSQLFASLERWKLRVFAIYYSQQGKDSLLEYVTENRDIVQFIRRRKRKMCRLMKNENDNFCHLRFFSKLNVEEIYGKPRKPRGNVNRHKERERGRDKARDQSKDKSKEDSGQSEPSQIFSKGNQTETETEAEKISEINKDLTTTTVESKILPKEEVNLDLTLKIKETLSLSTPEQVTPESPKKDLSENNQAKAELENSEKRKPESVAKPREDMNIKIFHCYARILKKKHSGLLLRPALSRTYSISTIFEKLIEFRTSLSNKSVSLDSQPILVTDILPCRSSSDVIWPILKTNPPFHSLGDRVISINTRDSDIQFGMLGTVIGEYKDCIEVLLDEPCIGGTDLKGRTPHFRGKNFLFLDVFNLSKWSSLIIENKHLNKLNNVWDGDHDVKGLISHIRSDFNRLKRQN